MINRIRLLPEHVANQIAAGEVIERPASVVKELVENALDASPTRLTIEIQAGGRSLVRVTDDGSGMSRDDALLCLERHATSKIRRAEDLSSLSTMGFRGEALPSIASVSRMSLTTRERDDDSPAAHQVVIHGGKIIEVKEAGAPHGTSVEVRQLFFNLPARRKFLRSEETEYAHIQHYLTLAALAHPQVAFTVVKDGRLIHQLPAVTVPDQPDGRLLALRERMRGLFGDERKFLKVEFEIDPGTASRTDEPADGDQSGPGSTAIAQPQFRIWGFIGQPGVSRATREDQHLFVNRRPVENRGLNFALIEGYHTALMKGRYPVCCLFLEMDPATVDVNIHPAKREVKFHNERLIRQLATEAVRETLLIFHQSSMPVSVPGTPAQVVPGTAADRDVPADSSGSLPFATDPAEHATVSRASALSRPGVPQAPVVPRPANPVVPSAQTVTTSLAEVPAARAAADRGDSSASSRSAVVEQTAAVVDATRVPVEPTPLLNVPLRLIGVIGKLYVVLESDRGMVLMDQHAAHERILFEQMLNRLESGEVPSQGLLLPETVEVSIRDAQFLREQLPELTRLGVGLSEFGERTFLLDAVPPLVKASDARRFVLELVDDLKASGHQVNAQRLGEHTIAKTVCRHAIKANDPLAGAELENLVNELRQCEMPYTCPHGRPTLIEMSFRELEKKFGRMT